MTPEHEKELYLRVDEVLHYLWDPVGVSHMPMARDEYQSYIPQVVALLNENASVEQIASYLNAVATKRMGLSENCDAALHVAGVLLEWKAALTAT